MILLVTTSSRAKECAAALERGARRKVQVAHSVARAVSLLQSSEYDALVVDESLVEIDDCAIDTLLHHAGLAMPIYINLGLHCTERVVREVHAGLLRKEAERLGALRRAENLLRSELRGDITGILLSSELALRDSGLAPQVAEKINSVHELAERMRARLEPASVG